MVMRSMIISRSVAAETFLRPGYEAQIRRVRAQYFSAPLTPIFSFLSIASVIETGPFIVLKFIRV